MTEQTEDATAAGQQSRTGPLAAGATHIPHENQSGHPALQQLDPRPLRDIHHGRTGAMWTAVVIMTIAFLAAGIAMLIPNITVIIVSGGVFVAGMIVGIVLRALGYGLYQRT